MNDKNKINGEDKKGKLFIGDSSENERTFVDPDDVKDR